MLILLFGSQVLAENAGKSRDFSLSAQTKSDNRRKPLFQRLNENVATLHVGSDDVGRRVLVSRRSCHLMVDQYFSELARCD